MHRQAIRTRFFLNENPGFVTNAIIAIIVILYLLSSIIPNIYNFGSFELRAVLSGEIWRLATSLFMYPPDPSHTLLSVLISILSLFFVGRVVEMFYGPYRYL